MKEMKQKRLLKGSVVAAIAMFALSCNQPQESAMVFIYIVGDNGSSAEGA
jgi:hypothetical protein